MTDEQQAHRAACGDARKHGPHTYRSTKGFVRVCVGNTAEPIEGKDA